MAKKRKLPSKSTDSTSTTTTTTTTPPQKQQPPKKIPKKTQQQNDKQQQQEQEAAKKQQQLQQQQEITQQQEDEEEEDVEEEEEYEEIEEEFEEEEQQQQEDEEDDEEDDDVEEQKGEETIVEDDEPIPDLLDPFTKDQLMMILREAAEIHPDVASRIRKVADEDTIHRKIFVHGLGWDTTTETLKSAFTEYGDIEDCKAVTDKVSGKSKGYGFILFKTRSGAKKALKEPQKRIGGRMTACQLAAVGPGAPVGFGVGGGGGSGGMQGGGGGPVSEYTQRKIYVSNVASEIDPGKLTAFFSRFGEIEEGPLGLDKKTGKPKGFCLFVYKSVESAKKALEEPHKKFEGCVLHCQKAIDGPKPGKQQMGHGHGHGHGPGQGRGKHFSGRGGNSSMAGGMGGGPGGGAGMMGQNVGFNQGAVGAPAPGLNPALGQALTALLASQGAGLGLNNLLGTLGGGGGGGGYGGQSVGMSPSVLGGYGAQGGLQNAYPNQQMGQGGSGRSQHGHMGGGYAGH